VWCVIGDQWNLSVFARSHIFYDELKHVNHSIDFLLKGETISFFPEPPVHKNGDGIEIIPPKN
jgi:hypothetical protein